MTARVRVSRPSRGWLKFVWQSPTDIDPVTRKALDALEQIPGVRIAGMTLEAPLTSWMLNCMSGLLSQHAHVTCYPGVATYIGDRGALFPWQKKAVEFALWRSGTLLADEMGLGKTRSAAVAAALFSEGETPDRPCYVFAPLFTLSTWRRELVLSGVLEKESDLCVLKSKDHRNDVFNPEARWYFCHYDVLPHWASRLSMHRRGKPAAVIYDEIHRLKNPTAQRSKAAMLVGSGSLFRMGLTGTPMDVARDLFSPLSLVTGPFTWGSFSAFRERYCGAFNETGHGLTDHEPTNVEELRSRMAPFFLRRTIASSGAKLPPLVRRQVTAFLTPAQRTQHDTALGKASMTELVQAILEGRAGKKTLETLMKVRKVTGVAKLATTIDFVGNLLDQGENVVVFCWQPERAAQLARELDGFCVHGGVRQELRDLVIKSWSRGPQSTIGRGVALVATYGVLREGVTLTRARHVVLHDLDWTPSVVLQAEARVYRIGQDKPTFSHWVTAEDSIDTLLARVLLAKAEQASKTLDLGEALKAVDELQLKQLVDGEPFDPVAWAKEQLGKWRGV